jgi:hypothetical protein
LEAEHLRLRERIRRFGDCRDGSEIVRRLLDPELARGFGDRAAQEAEDVISNLSEAAHDAR